MRAVDEAQLPVTAPVSVFMRLLAAYRRHGYRVRVGLNPHYFADPDAAFAHFVDDGGRLIGVGGGIDPQELHFLELLVSAGVRPERVLIIGNAFGWSALAMGMLLPTSRVVAMEADLEGDGTATGTALTARIAEEEELNVRVVQALSPRDTPEVVAREFDGEPLDLVFIDGLHVNEQLMRDVEGVLPFCGAKTVFLLHDVLSWHMVQAFNTLDFGHGHERRLLTRTPSGMGLVFPSDCDRMVRDVIDAFCDDTVDVPRLFSELGATEEWPGRTLEARLSKGWKHRRFGMSKTWAREGRPADERRELARLAAERPHDAVAVYELGAWDAQHGGWAAAIESLRAAQELAPAWAPAVQQLGRALRETGQLVEARACLERAAALDPSWAAPQLELGLVAAAEGDHTRAVSHLSAAVTLDSGWDLAELELGLAAFRCGDAVTARRVLAQALARNPDQPRAVHPLALATESLDCLPAAAGLFEKAAALLPLSAEAQFDCARARRATGDLRAAADAYRLAVRWRPDWPEAHFDCGSALKQLGDLPGALVHFTQVVALRPDWAEAHFDCGSTLSELGDVSASLKHFQQAMTLQPDWVDARLACGRAAFDAQAFALVVEAIAPLAASGDAPGDALHILGLSLERIGDLAGAFQTLEQAVNRMPDSAEAHFDLGRVSAALGDDRRALSHFARVLRLRQTWVEAGVLCGAAAYRLGAAAKQRTAASDDSNESASSGREAMRHSLHAAELQPEWIEAWVVALEAATGLDDPQPLARALSALTHLLPCSTPLWYELGRVQARLGNGASACDACERGMALELWTEPVKATGETLLAHGQAEHALALLGAAVARLPSWAGAHFVRGRAFESFGDMRSAHAAYAQAHALRPAWRAAAESASRTAPRDTNRVHATAPADAA